ncbi:uncharacterized protein EI90DRAFT_1019413 [Cantharellus anzutake]|uniref:uncharacterized protein n=1 Tax=Cantharellus anzutake TaxID=1750568 RepID=UPI00190612EC|nr:uncharacterized protein EI90DRAFT_1019413 [Cantharellus anzutake]KAF8331408.1 hypothetical protein EI90DRAFT_1019413 [Cantharellus anzutake]
MQDSLLNHLRNAESRFVWLRGSPGTGKTAICKSISSTLDRQGALAASFFWDKNRKGTGLDSIEMFPSALAYQLAHFSADYEILLVKQLQDPALRMVQSLPLEEQMRALVIKPMGGIKDMLSSGEEHLAIVLDGLDECGNQEALESLMRLVMMLEGLPSAFAVLVSSRPETQVIRAQAQGGVWGDVIPCENMDMINKSETFRTIRRMVDDGLKIRISESLWKPLEEELDTFASACRELPVIASMRIREVCAQTQRGATLKSEFDYFRNLLDAPTDLNSDGDDCCGAGIVEVAFHCAAFGNYGR